MINSTTAVWWSKERRKTCIRAWQHTTFRNMTTRCICLRRSRRRVCGCGRGRPSTEPNRAKLKWATINWTIKVWVSPSGNPSKWEISSKGSIIRESAEKAFQKKCITTWFPSISIRTMCPNVSSPPFPCQIRPLFFQTPWMCSVGEIRDRWTNNVTVMMPLSVMLRPLTAGQSNWMTNWKTSTHAFLNSRREISRTRLRKSLVSRIFNKWATCSL